LSGGNQITTWEFKAADWTAVSNSVYQLVGNNLTMTLPSSSVSEGDILAVYTVAGSQYSFTISGSQTTANNQNTSSSTITINNNGPIWWVYNSSDSRWKQLNETTSEASETVAGIIEIATNTEADAGTATNKALVPSNIGSINLSSFNDDLGSTYQPLDAQLTDVAGLTPADGAFIVGDGANFVTETLATARTSLGLGTAATSNTGDFLASTATLNDISDVTITGVSNGQVISYNSTSGEWENSTPSSGGATDLDGLSDVTITSVTGGDLLQNNGSGQFVNVGKSTIALSSFNDDLSYQPLDAQLTDVAGLTPADGAFIVGDGANFVTESGATARTSLGAIAEISEDSTPQLGGPLDTNGQDIITVSNADLDLAPNGTGLVVVRGNQTGGNNQGAIKLNCEQNTHGVTIKSPAHASAATYTLTLPVNDGDADQVLKTDGSGVLSWVDQASGGGGGFTYSAITADPAPAVKDTHYSCTGTFTITLPAVSGTTAGDQIRVKNIGTGTVTIDGASSETVDGATTFAMDVQWSAITLVSNGSTGWEII
jgi:hypothetical protein